MYNSGKKIKVFLCGDYEFEMRSYGLSGASGNFILHLLMKQLLCVHLYLG